MLVRNQLKRVNKKLSTPKSQVAYVMVPPEEITNKVNEVIAKYVDTSAINRNKLIDGQSVNRRNCNSRPRKRLNGSALKIK